MGKEIYENFYKNYTIKQWGIHPRNLNKSLIDCQFDLIEDPYYVNQKLKVMPKKGYKESF